MSEELDELYREVILDHTKRPRNFRAIEKADRTADGHNRLCGDKLKLYVMVRDGVVTDVAFQGQGCSISTASASMMTEAIKGRRLEDVEAMFKAFHDVVTGPPDEIPDVPEELGKLAAFAGVRKFPVRVKCATLCWHTLQAALKDEHKPVSTEGD